MVVQVIVNATLLATSFYVGVTLEENHMRFCSICVNVQLH